MEECSFEGCKKPVKCKTLCIGHYGQMRLGKPLTPLKVYPSKAKVERTPRKKYTADDKCLHEGCEKTPMAKDRCGTHYSQFRQYGETFDGNRERVPGAPLPIIVSETERYCRLCKKTVDWKAYCLDQKKCRECHREYLSREVDVVRSMPPQPNNAEANWNALIAFLNTK